MDKNPIHPASIISKNLLSKALIDLLPQKHFKDITITRLCGRAQVARRTFYRNFGTLEDVLSYYTAGIINSFVRDMQQYRTSSKETVFSAYFSFWNDHRNLLLLLNQDALIPILFSDYIKSMFLLPMFFETHAPDGAVSAASSCRLVYVPEVCGAF